MSCNFLVTNFLDFFPLLCFLSSLHWKTPKLYTLYCFSRCFLKMTRSISSIRKKISPGSLTNSVRIQSTFSAYLSAWGCRCNLILSSDLSSALSQFTLFCFLLVKFVLVEFPERPCGCKIFLTMSENTFIRFSF